jgi:16S rRNA (cytosine1402-N4)-methyltransferase
MNVVNVVPMPTSSLPPPSSPAPHLSVMTAEVLAAMAPRSSGIYVDATVGAGGHAAALLAAGAGHLIGFDRDQRALGVAAKRLEPFVGRFDLRYAAFGDLRAELDALGIDRVDGILADLGVSSMQLDDPLRGMSFRAAGPLDMRMDRTHGETAAELIERLDDDGLADVLFALGEERRARRVARCIKQALAAGELRTTLDLRRAVVKALGPARSGGVDPATRTFQALRIAVNGELDQLESLLDAASSCLRDGGVLAVIAFHSLEDRLVKRMLRAEPSFRLYNKKPIVAGPDEVDDNPRARSAKLRVAHLTEGSR